MIVLFLLTGCMCGFAGFFVGFKTGVVEYELYKEQMSQLEEENQRLKEEKNG